MIRFVKPQFPEFEGSVKVEEWGMWVKLSPYHDPVFIPKEGNEPNIVR